MVRNGDPNSDKFNADKYAVLLITLGFYPNNNNNNNNNKTVVQYPVKYL
jgi:hypothetical protein